jgi:hypothetical protein
MSKIKDLATVIVNDLEVRFPVNEERYELFSAFEQFYKEAAHKPLILLAGHRHTDYWTEPESFRVNHTIQEAIEAYHRVFSVPFRSCTLKEMRLTQRLLKACEEYAALVDIPKVERETLVGLHTLLWAVVLYKLSLGLGL